MAMYGVTNVKLKSTCAPIVPVMAPTTHNVLNPTKSIRKPQIGEAKADIK